jgi:hypothetical protein
VEQGADETAESTEAARDSRGERRHEPTPRAASEERDADLLTLEGLEAEFSDLEADLAATERTERA